MPASSLLNTAAGAKIVVTAGGAYFQPLVGGPVLLDATDIVNQLPIGSKLVAVDDGPPNVLITITIPGRGSIPAQRATPQSAAPNVVQSGFGTVAGALTALTTHSTAYRPA